MKTSIKRHKTIKSQIAYGFTLVELLIVVLILGILAAVAVPRVTIAREQAEINAMMAEKNAILTAIDEYFADTGRYPIDQIGGVLPPEIAPYLDSRVFVHNRPLTGTWDWSLTEHGLNASLSLVDWTPNLALWQRIDQEFDDANTSTGSIRIVNAYGGYFLVFPVQE